MHQPRHGRLSPSTVAGRVRSLKRLFNFLTQEEVIESNPAEQRGLKAADFQDFLALLAACGGDNLHDR
jgi:site-specific recombinase XerD